jgi:hypothetical protein
MIKASEIFNEIGRRRCVSISIQVLAYQGLFGYRRNLGFPSVDYGFSKT